MRLKRLFAKPGQIYFFCFTELVGLSMPWPGFYMSTFPLQPGLHFYESNPIPENLSWFRERETGLSPVSLLTGFFVMKQRKNLTSQKPCGRCWNLQFLSKIGLKKYAYISHHSWHARPPASAVENPGFLNHKNQPCPGKTINPVHKSGPGDSKGFSPGQTKYMFLVSRVCRAFNTMTRFLYVHFSNISQRPDFMAQPQFPAIVHWFRVGEPWLSPVAQASGLFVMKQKRTWLHKKPN